MLPIHPTDLEIVIRDRQERMRATPHPAAPRTGMRVRIGHALIALGISVSGERAQSARPHSLPVAH
jgi:hypothetical protein